MDFTLDAVARASGGFFRWFGVHRSPTVPQKSVRKDMRPRLASAFGEAYAFANLGGVPLRILITAEMGAGEPGIRLPGQSRSCEKAWQRLIYGALNDLGIGLPAKMITIWSDPCDECFAQHHELAVIAAVLAANGVLDREELSCWLLDGSFGLTTGMPSAKRACLAALVARQHDLGMLSVSKMRGGATAESPTPEETTSHVEDAQLFDLAHRLAPRLEDVANGWDAVSVLRGTGSSTYERSPLSLDFASTVGFNVVLAEIAAISQKMAAIAIERPGVPRQHLWHRFEVVN